jgi:alpha-glucosidase
LHSTRLVVRKATPALLEGEYQSYKAPDGVFAYLRGSEVLVALNFSDQPKTLSLPGGEILLSTHLDRYGGVTGQLELRPNEGVVVRL